MFNESDDKSVDLGSGYVERPLKSVQRGTHNQYTSMKKKLFVIKILF